MTKKSVKTVLIAIAAIALCIALIVAGSYALFTDSTPVKNHLQAGRMEMTLKRTNLVGKKINAAGILDDYTNGAVVDFTRTTTRDQNVFGFTFDSTTSDADDLADTVTNKVVPGTTLTATMELDMTDRSNVAYAYWVEFVVADETGKLYNIDENSNHLALAEQIVISINNDTPVKLSEIANNSAKLSYGSESAPLGEVHVEDDVSTPSVDESKATFTVTVTFLDDFVAANGLTKGDNNDAQGQLVMFDMVVHAVQLVA